MNRHPLLRLLTILLPGILPLSATEFPPVFVSGAVLLVCPWALKVKPR